MRRQSFGFIFIGALVLAGSAGPVASVCLRLDALGLAAPASSVRSENSQAQQQGVQQQQQPQRGGGAPQGGRGGGGGRGAVAVMALTTTGWTDGGTVALKYTQAGDEVSPPLAWNGAPSPTTSFVLVVRDID